MAVASISDLLLQFKEKQRAQYEPKNAEQWHLLRTFWTRYSDFNRQLILKVAGIAGEPRDLAAYSNGEKRQIAQAVRDMLAFADEDRALNGKERKLWRELNREFMK